MYYENKFGFYIRQYATQIIVGAVCLVIVLSGLLIYIKVNDSSSQESTTIIGEATENNVEIYEETSVAEDDSMLPDDLRELSAGEKISVKIASVENDGTLVIIYGSDRIKAKLIGIDFSEIMPDTMYNINADLEGTYADIAFDESKVSDGYAMIYVYKTTDTLYNSQILKTGRAILDSSLSKKALEYNDLAESQAYAKQTLAGVWEY